MKSLPPLNALRTFIAVVRHGGVSKAADALHLTHSAISHQIRALQDELGIALFERSGRGLALSPNATRFAERIEAAFSEIEAATLDLTSGSGTRLRISTIPSFAARWLLPRLGDFISACPEIDVEVQSSLRLADIKGGDVDIEVRFGPGFYPGLHSELLLRDWLYPVCSPEFARKYALCDGSGIDGVPLLHSGQEPWTLWFPKAGIDADEPRHGTLFEDSGLMLQAAAAGQGLCLARHTITQDDLAARRLVRPFSAYVESPFAYHFVCRKEKLEATPVRKFREWLIRQIASFPERPE